MKQFILLVSGLLLLGQSDSSAWGQTSPKSDDSHRLLPTNVNRGSAEERLADRLRRSRDMSSMKGLVERILTDPEKFGMTRERLAELLKSKSVQRLAEQIRQDPSKFNFNPKDPEWQEVLRRVQEKGNFKPEDLDLIKKTVGDLKPPRAPDPPDRPPVDPNVKKPNPDDKPPNPDDKPKDPRATTPPTSPNQKPPPSSSSSSSTPSPRSSDNRSLLSRQVRDLLGGNNLAKNVRAHVSGLLDRTGLDTRSFGRDARQWVSGLLPPLETARLGGLRDSLGGLLPSDLGRSLCSFDVKIGRAEAVSTAGTIGRTLSKGVIVLVALAVVGVIGYLIVTRTSSLAPRQTAASWHPGAWPVAPAAVHTRGDLIQAFEHLALLRLGYEARAYNHVDIGERLGAETGDPFGQRHQAAEELANLYEQARYAPPDDPLSEDEVSTARQDLCLLAGVPAA